MKTTGRNIAARRFLAFGVDWLVIAVWGGLLFAVVMILFDGQPPRSDGPWQSQVIGLVFMTVPVVLYFAFSEASRFQATLGKRALGLRVVTEAEDRVSFGKSLLRTGIKFAPWELGHLVANQAVFSATEVANWIYLPMALACLLPVYWILCILLRGHAPYDSLTSTRVVFVS